MLMNKKLGMQDQMNKNYGLSLLGPRNGQSCLITTSDIQKMFPVLYCTRKKILLIIIRTILNGIFCSLSK